MVNNEIRPRVNQLTALFFELNLVSDKDQLSLLS